MLYRLGTFLQCAETYKILTGKSNVDPQTWFSFASDTDMRTRATTGYLNLVQPPPAKTDVRKNFFSHRVVPHWNQLPDHVKMAQKTDCFKSALDSITNINMISFEEEKTHGPHS